MKTEPILRELEAVKERLAADATGESHGFLDQMESWLERHPHTGPVANSPEELQARLRARETNEPAPLPARPYRVHNSIIAEIHRTRAALYREKTTGPLILKDEPPGKHL